MQGDRLEARSGTSFFLKHGAPDTVQAIGLRGRPVAFVDAQDQPLFARSEGGQYIQGGSIIGINADKDAVVLITPAVQRIAQHPADHIGLLPGGNEDGDAARLPRSRQGRRRHSLVARIDNQLAPQPTTQEHGVYNEIIDPANRQSHNREQQNFMMNPRQNNEDGLPHGMRLPVFPGRAMTAKI